MATYPLLAFAPTPAFALDIDDYGLSEKRLGLAAVYARTDAELLWRDPLVLILLTVAIASLLPYLPSYLENLSVPTTSIATYQGVLLATLGICESTFAIPWTRLADHIGRKPVIIATLIAQLLGNLGLSFCTQIWQAFACMAVIGIANGNVAVMRAIVAEMVTAKEHQARAFSFTPMASAAGTLLGSLSGGWLSGLRLGGEWPAFVLPSLISAAVFLPAVGCAILKLEETGRVKLGYEKVSFDTSKEIDDDDSSISFEEGSGNRRRTPVLETTSCQLLAHRPQPLHLAQRSHSPTLRRVGQHASAHPSVSIRPSTTSSVTSIFTSAYGYGTTPRFTGLLFSAACVPAMAVSSMIYPRLAKTKSHFQLLSYTLLAYPLIYFAFPFTLLPTSQILSLGLLTVLFLLKGGAFICALQASMICFTNSVEKEDVALAHGVNFTLGGHGRGLGSAVVGGLFEAGLRFGAIVLPFGGLAVVSAGVVLGSRAFKTGGR